MGTMYGSDATFLGVARADQKDPSAYMEADVLIVGAPFDGGTTYRAGARFGPHAIRTTDYMPLNGTRPHLSLGLDPLRDQWVVDIGDVLMVPGEIEASLQRLEQAVSDIVQLGALPVVLGGDHSISLADVNGVAAHYGAGRLGLVHFDAHSDAAESSYGSRLGHGTWVRRLVEAEAVRGDEIVQIGHRNGGSRRGRAWRDAHGIRAYEMREIGRRGLDTCLDEAVDRLARECDAVFLSIDLDAVDPAFAPGIGTPEPGGLTSRQLLDAVERLGLELPLAGVDVAELAPPYDGPGQITASLANRVVLEILAASCRRRKDGLVRRGSGSEPLDTARADGGNCEVDSARADIREEAERR
jgi:agmatinase